MVEFGLIIMAKPKGQKLEMKESERSLIADLLGLGGSFKILIWMS